MVVIIWDFFNIELKEWREKGTPKEKQGKTAVPGGREEWKEWKRKWKLQMEKEKEGERKKEEKGEEGKPGGWREEKRKKIKSVGIFGG